MSPLEGIRHSLPSGVRWSGPFIVALLSMAIGAVVVLDGVVSLFGSFTVPSPSPEGASLADAMAVHDQFSDLCVRRTEGRSLFSPPSPPPRRVVVAPPPPPPTPPPTPPTPPAPLVPPSYTGPEPVGMLPNAVIFKSAGTIRIGEESGGVKVLEVVDGRTIRLGHAGGIYLVDAFKKSTLDSISRPWTEAGLPDGVGTGIRPLIQQPADPGSEEGEDTRGERSAEDPEAALPSAANDPAAAEATPSVEGAVPEPISEESVSAMSREDAIAALMRIRDAKNNPQLSPSDRSRMELEQKLLLQHLQTAARPTVPASQQPPAPNPVPEPR
ncbi:MAG: hypothetical protein O2819_01180 [Planctomycetota bacterium]|nr:hypothetical protein [Planctomycetota bacterium]MDA1105605.1 hypothetical protein [Planctomycetota bacterium]